MTNAPTASGPDRQYVLVSKNGHHYLFSYRSGRERELYFAFIDCARDPSSELGWAEVLTAMQHVAPFAARTPPQP